MVQPSPRNVQLANRAEWLVERSKRIGASDAPKILGLGGSAFEVYVSKVVAAAEDRLSEAAELGTELEPAVARVTGRRLGCIVEAPPPHSLYVRDDLPFLHASPDRFLHPDDQPERTLILEIKSTGAHREDEWAEGVPLRHQVQVQTQLLVLGLERAVVSAVFGTFGFSIRTFPVVADPEFQAALVVQLETFWQKVQARTPPEPTAGTDLEAVKRLFPTAVVDKSIQLDERAEEILNEWQLLEAQKEAIYQRAKVRKTQLLTMMEDAQLGVFPSGRRLKWALETRRMPPIQARTVYSRVPRILKAVKELAHGRRREELAAGAPAQGESDRSDGGQVLDRPAEVPGDGQGDGAGRGGDGRGDGGVPVGGAPV